MKFIDSTEVIVRSGAGGRGNVSFARGPCQPKLGPDGGDGGFGGSVYFLGDSGLNTLQSLRFRRIFQAKNGNKGGTNNKTGRDGIDIVIKVPLGTMCFDMETENLHCEVVEHGQMIMVAKGGKRGLGNSRFVSSTHQAPEEFTTGGPSLEYRLRMELKVIADVGLAGFPNAGKSTLLSRISAARPKIADYPFTTLTPQLGVCSLESSDGDWGHAFVVADIPGLIEGASQGKGLGFEFLKHLERTKLIAFLLDGSFADEIPPPQEAFEKLRDELITYNPEFERKRFVIVLTKQDLLIDQEKHEEAVKHFEAMNYTVMSVSSATGHGLDQLKRKLFYIVTEERESAKVSELPFPYRSELPKISDFELITKHTDA